MSGAHYAPTPDLIGPKLASLSSKEEFFHKSPFQSTVLKMLVFVLKIMLLVRVSFLGRYRGDISDKIEHDLRGNNFSKLI